jgi:two-component system chemotaxis sensor kinase CheA
MSIKEEMIQAFYDEAGDLLPELENSLLQLEASPGDADQIDRVFRALHTLKGSGSMFGFEAVAAFSHELETAFDHVRSGNCQVTARLLDLSLKAKDHIQQVLFEPEKAEEEAAELLLKEVRTLQPESNSHDCSPVKPRSSENCDRSEETVYRIRFRPEPDVFATGTDPFGLLAELGELGRTHVIAHTEGIPMLDELNPESCSTWWDVLLITEASSEAIQDVFLFVEERSELLIEALGRSQAIADEAQAFRELAETLSQGADPGQEILQKIVASNKPQESRRPKQAAETVQQAPASESKGKGTTEFGMARNQPETADSIRVPSAKLDRLVDLVGELVIAQSRLSQTVGGMQSKELVSLSEEMERLSDELRDSTLAIRMVPIGSTFGRFRRVVRDLSQALGKAIELQTDGAETELDKTVIERLADPLVHLLRNAIDHGIESPEERERAGKPRQGRIRLSARHSGGNVLISIADDGRGIDPEAIRAKATAKGLISSDVEPSAKELINMIFAPGLSTAREVSDISGRGVGMDVVKSNIESLRGSVEIESQAGFGSTVTVKLPLTLAIIEGLQVRIGQDVFVLPLQIVEECIEHHQQARTVRRSHECIDFRGEVVPYVNLRDWFGISGPRPEREQIVVVSSEEAKVGFVIDEIIGQFQTVIKSLSRVYKDVKGISGATIRGDGGLALIIDAQQLIASMEAQVGNNTAQALV